MKMDQDRYNKIKEQLIESTQWPSMYMFKFIVPNNKDKLNAVLNEMARYSSHITNKTDFGFQETS